MNATDHDVTRGCALGLLGIVPLALAVAGVVFVGCRLPVGRAAPVGNTPWRAT
jgi:hypothetical protein